ncbi:DUF3883 domain-containing protein [Hymenobacter busanensis]|uniref:DUF3883 domain-containing protein n=1 Tax=Hymenobacter busanensis TaxID=2607656 RepID=A0A7L4ZSK8_9BACT|nr:DUF3883 domain-containing protein [Hymenobacter busanensis]KAA9327231.1 DUF3883 domain-containing protein [Hymenobacter busanensis]QHJ05897.1 DUF3883 domain-containing protein [Hymenobacter busanensis]
MSHWSRIEVEAIVRTYFDMLNKELHGERVNKKEANRQLNRILTGRTLASIEFKHANMSAVLLDLGFPYVDGYKPRSNYQELLREVVEAHLALDKSLLVTVKNLVEQPALVAATDVDLELAFVPAPQRQPSTFHRTGRGERVNRPRLGVNYLEREANNASLGKAGEEFVLEVEHARLWKAGHRSLAERIEHVSQTQGDGLGYDVLSFEISGKERPIEVKTTRFGPLTPFYASNNEVNVSRLLDNYQLYRVFNYGKGPKVFVLPGLLDQSCTLEPTHYRALVG